MMWKRRIKNKLISIEDAVSKIQSDMNVVVAQAASEPQGCMSKFHLVASKVQNVRVFSVLTMNRYDFFAEQDMMGHFELCSWFHGPGVRRALKEGVRTISHVPAVLHRAFRDFLTVRQPHIFFGTCTPPDSDGYVSLSLGTTYERDAIDSADCVILEVNEALPVTYGDTRLNISEADYFVENHVAPPAIEPEQPGEIEMEVGRHVASMVEDGSTIQIGIGAIPNAAGTALRSKKDLGVHTEMAVDAMMELAVAGAITNRRKTLVRDKSVCTFALGSRRFYEWLNGNSSVEFRRGAWVNDPSVIRQNARMVSINTCLMVDLTGQVGSETFGTAQYSGTGGQLDTAMGAMAGTDGHGKSIIACLATAKSGEVSRIVPALPEGTAVTLHRSFCDHVVTEYGVACLRSRTIRERAHNLIAIAHPKFRDQLTSDAAKLGYL